MPPPRFSTITEQVTERLREGLSQGRWVGTMPGRGFLVEEMGVSGKTIETALRQLQKEGLLVSQGAGRKRRIELPKNLASPSLRVAILDYDPIQQTEGYMVELQHLLGDAGHTAFFTRKSLTEVGMEVERVARLVEQTPADAWIVGAGSREVLGWFAEQQAPAFALFGRMETHTLAGAKPDKRPALIAAVRHLVRLGHRRIVLLAREERRQPEPGRSERAVLQELEAQGIPTGSYNLPDWEETSTGFHALLERLFQVTPPTALLVEEAPFFTATMQFCNQQGIRVPADLSLICTDPDPHFAWCQPSIAHIAWEVRPVVRRIVRWAENVSRGREDYRQTLTKAEFVPGGTVGKWER